MTGTAENRDGGERHLRISACIIMRDAAEDIGACLGSMQGEVDEFVVVDTGSVDDSVEIAGKIVGKVYHFPWQEDFSAAKNYAIGKATGDWIVFPDADEYFTEATRGNLRAILSRWPLEEAPDTMEVLRHNIRTDTGEKLNENYAERIFRRDPALRYHDAIHEYLAYDDGRKRQCLRLPPEDLLIFHTGYSPERMAGKTARNLRMLEDIRAKGLEKKYLYYYLAGLYMHEGEYGKAAEAAWASIEHGERPDEYFFDPYRLCYQAYLQMEDEEGIFRILRRGMEDWPRWPDFFVVYAARMKKKGEQEEALKSFRRALRNDRDFARNFPGQRNDIRKYLPAIYKEMAELWEARGNVAEARRCRRKAEKAERESSSAGGA